MPQKNNTVRKDGRYAVQVYIGRENGKRKYKTVYGKSQKEANNKAREIKNQLAKGVDLIAENTFGEWKNKWLAFRKNQMTPARYKETETRCEYFSDVFDIKLIDLRPVHFQEIIDELAVENPFTHNPSSYRLLSEIKGIATQIIRYAIENRITDYNPALYVKISAQNPPQKRRALTKEEQQRVREFPHRAQTAAMIMLYSGLRRGELTALTWDNVDLDNKTITVNKSFDFKNKKIKPPKTLSGSRIIYIPDVLVDYLKSVKRTNVLVFPSASGNMMSVSAWRRLWDSYLLDMDIHYYPQFKEDGTVKQKSDPEKRQLTLEPFTPHCLRHTFCTLMYSAGIPAVSAMEQMGHADISTTLGVYTHISKEQQQTDISKLNSFISANASQDASQKAENR